MYLESLQVWLKWLQVMAQVAEEHLDEDSVHTALLIVNLDSAFGLPVGIHKRLDESH